MATKIGGNVHTQALKNRRQLLSDAEQLQSGGWLVMDDRGLAIELKRLLPRAAIMHRAYFEGDRHFHETGTAKQFYERHARDGEDGIIVQVLNEPKESARLSDFMADACHLFGRIGHSIGVGSFGTGGPREDNLKVLRSMFDALRQWKHLHYYNCHEYGGYRGLMYTDVTHLRDMFPWRIGRAKRFVVPYCQQQHGFTPRVFYSEGGGDTSFYLTDERSKDGWKSYPWDQNRYADELIQIEQKVYDDEFSIAYCVYCLGNTGGWHNWDIEGARTLMERLIAHSHTAPPPPLPPTPPPSPSPNISLAAIARDLNSVNVRLQQYVKES